MQMLDFKLQIAVLTMSLGQLQMTPELVYICCTDYEVQRDNAACILGIVAGIVRV
jgi:hypothetical protein